MNEVKDPERTTDTADRVEAFVGMKLHSCCIDHGRDWRETDGGRLPPSEHSPGCENYRPIRYCRVRHRELHSSFVDTPQGVAEFLVDDEDPSQYDIEDVWMTDDQFARLAEFDGF